MGVCFFFSFFEFEFPIEAAATLISSLPRKISKRRARDVFDLFALHTGLAYDVTDTDCWAQSWGCYRDFQMVIFNKPDEKSTEKLLCVYFILFIIII